MTPLSQGGAGKHQERNAHWAQKPACTAKMLCSSVPPSPSLEAMGELFLVLTSPSTQVRILHQTGREGIAFLGSSVSGKREKTETPYCAHSRVQSSDPRLPMPHSGVSERKSDHRGRSKECLPGSLHLPAPPEALSWSTGLSVFAEGST